MSVPTYAWSLYTLETTESARSLTGSRTLSATVSNESDAPKYFGMMLWASASADSVSPIPEPGTLWLAACGAIAMLLRAGSNRVIGRRAVLH